MAIALAYALLFQGLAGAMAGTLHAFGPRALADGAWCLPSGTAPAGEPASHAPACCLLGCAVAKPAPTGGPGIALAAPALREAAIRFIPPLMHGATTAFHAGFDARGPPGSA